MPIKLIIFDLDGTLIDSLADIREAVNYALKPLGIGDKSEAEVRALIGRGISSLIERAIGSRNLGHLDATVARFMDYYASHLTDHTVLYPGVIASLDKLDRYKKGIISNKRELFVKKIIHDIGLSQRFELLFGSDSAAERKPSPLPVIKMLDHFRVDPGETVIVGDSDVDIATGKAARIKTIAVSYGYGNRENLHDAHIVIDDMHELPASIELL